VLMTALRVSHPWSIRSPSVDELPVFRACFPSQLSKISLAYTVDNQGDSEKDIHPIGYSATDSKAKHSQENKVRDHDENEPDHGNLVTQLCLD
jgi:hypothetical protein